MSIIDFNYQSSVPTSDQVRRQYKINQLAKNNQYLGEDGRSVYKYNPKTRKYSFISEVYGGNVIKKGTRAYVDGKLVDITAGNYTPHYYTEDAKRTRDIEDFARRNPHLVGKAKILAQQRAREKTYENPKRIPITSLGTDRSKPIYGFNGNVQTFKNTLNNLGITDRNGVRKMQEQLRNAGYNISVDGIWGNNTQSAYEDLMKQAAYKPNDTIEESLPESILTKHTTPNFNWRNVTAPLAEKNISRLLPLTTSQSTDINYAKNGAKLVFKNPIQRFKERTQFPNKQKNYYT